MTDIAVTTNDPTKRVFQWATILMLVGFMVMPTLDLFIRPDKVREPTVELRNAAPAPTTPHSWLEFFEYPRKFEAHWNDTFGLRDKFLRWHSIFKVLGLGIAPNRNHTIGKDHWIFNRQSSIFETYRGVLPLKPGELENWRQRIERRSAECARLGARYLFVVCPDKPHIYPEYLPDNVRRVGPSRMEQLFDVLRTKSNVEFVDLRPALIDEKKNDKPETDDFVYYPLGTHWTTRGGLRGTNAIIDALKPHFPGLKNVPVAAMTSDPPKHYGDTEARNMYIRDLLTQWEHWWKPVNARQHEVACSYEGDRFRITTIDDPSLPKAILFHDSFGSYLDRAMAECFSRLEMYWSYDFDLKKIAVTKPDVVIEMIVERALVFQNPKQLTPGEADSPSNGFYQTNKTVFRVDPSKPPRNLVAVNRAKISNGTDVNGPFLILESFGVPDSFALAELPLKVPNATYYIHLTIEVPRDDNLKFFFKRESDAAWTPEQNISSPVGAGLNDLYLTLESGSGLEGLVLQPLTLRGTSTLRALEIRER